MMLTRWGHPGILQLGDPKRGGRKSESVGLDPIQDWLGEEVQVGPRSGLQISGSLVRLTSGRPR
jgi:hypothetical protein